MLPVLTLLLWAAALSHVGYFNCFRFIYWVSWSNLLSAKKSKLIQIAVYKRNQEGECWNPSVGFSWQLKMYKYYLREHSVRLSHAHKHDLHRRQASNRAGQFAKKSSPGTGQVKWISFIQYSSIFGLRSEQLNTGTVYTMHFIPHCWDRHFSIIFRCKSIFFWARWWFLLLLQTFNR